MLFSDMGEANSRKVIDICRQYGVVEQRTGGYTPENNAFAERWFRTIAKMSTCQMLQFDLPDNMWEDSRRMATFIYNRVPPTRQTPGEEWLSPHQKQYPTRETMDLTKLQPFGIPCWVYQKKPFFLKNLKLIKNNDNALPKTKPLYSHNQIRKLRARGLDSWHFAQN